MSFWSTQGSKRWEDLEKWKGSRSAKKPSLILMWCLHLRPQECSSKSQEKWISGTTGETF